MIDLVGMMQPRGLRRNEGAENASPLEHLAFDEPAQVVQGRSKVVQIHQELLERFRRDTGGVGRI
jgi:hypothetical protein